METEIIQLAEQLPIPSSGSEGVGNGFVKAFVPVGSCETLLHQFGLLRRSQFWSWVRLRLRFAIRQRASDTRTVWLKSGDIDIPPELAAAHPAGDLVFFVGAGASCDSPSDLPNFEKLVEKIAARNGLDYNAAHPFDEILGRFQADGVDVHREIQEIISNPASKPNKLHKAIVELATVFDKPQIITTNYDRHLSQAMTSVLADGDEYDEFPSMAFPQRDDFTGIVYLHGSVREPPENMVATDSDFAKAYLLAASTASQFLGRVFENSTVLFIGYSHSDTLMGYIARGLPAGTRRYAFYEINKEQRWDEFGIVPVQCDGYEFLPDALRDWASQARRGIGDHEQNIRRIAETSHPLQPADESDMREALVHIERLCVSSQNTLAAPNG